jgi:aldehyde:ferredoxin oxidoreductase
MSLSEFLGDKYSWMGSMPSMMANFYNSVVGVDIDEVGLRQAGERIVNVERAFNLREGLTRKDDTLPDRMLKDPMPDGVAKGQIVNLDPMLDEYYALRRWDRNSGLTKRKLIELNLEDLADDLERIGKLGK